MLLSTWNSKRTVLIPKFEDYGNKRSCRDGHEASKSLMRPWKVKEIVSSKVQDRETMETRVYRGSTPRAELNNVAWRLEGLEGACRVCSKWLVLADLISPNNSSMSRSKSPVQHLLSRRTSGRTHGDNWTSHNTHETMICRAEVNQVSNWETGCLAGTAAHGTCLPCYKNGH